MSAPAPSVISAEASAGPGFPVIRSYEARVDDVKPNERAVIARIGGRAIDRHRSIIEPRGIDLTHYKNNPIVLWEHGRCPTRGTLPVGRNQWIKTDGDRLIAKTIFRDDAYSDELFRAYRDDWLRMWSVNVLAHEASPPTREEIRAMPELEHGCEVIYRRTELAEYSATAVGSHREAVTILASRGIWIPDEAMAEAEKRAGTTTLNVPLALERTTTDSLGGLSGGGATVKPGVRGEEEDEEDEGEEPRRKPGRKAKPSDEDEEDEDEAPPADAKRKPRPKPGGAAGHAEEPDEDEDDESAVKRFIRKKGSRFVIYSETGKKLGDYATREEAEHRLKQIEYFKHRDEGRRAAPSSKLDAIKEAIKGLPDLHPDYGQVFYDPDSDKVFINFSDSDDRDTTRKWVAAMAAIVGEDNVDGDAECGVEKYKSWIKVRSYAGPIRPDGRGGWSVHDPDGRVVATYRDRAVAEECLVAMGCSDGYERALLGLMAEQRARMEEQADDLIARIELRTLGRV